MCSNRRAMFTQAAWLLYRVLIVNYQIAYYSGTVKCISAYVAYIQRATAIGLAIYNSVWYTVGTYRTACTYNS